MSQENVEIVRRVDEVFTAGVESGDFGLAFDTGAVAAEFEWVAAAEMAEQRSYRGREEFVEFMRRWTEDFDGYSIQREELIDAGNDRVVGVFRQFATGKVSGAPVELEYSLVYDLMDGRLARVRAYLDRAEALEAAGLPEQA
jgi:ketosteroid isomerase-like protein